MGLLDYLASFAQGASNSAARLVSEPVDGINWVLNKNGIHIHQPVGGDEWMRDKGLVKKPSNALAGAIGDGVSSSLQIMVPYKMPVNIDNFLANSRNLIGNKF